ERWGQEERITRKTRGRWEGTGKGLTRTPRHVAVRPDLPRLDAGWPWHATCSFHGPRAQSFAGARRMWCVRATKPRCGTVLYRGKPATDPLVVNDARDET